MATAVVRADKIGDLVLATPVLEAIKQKHPEEKLFVICSRYAHRVLLNHPLVEELIVYDGKNGREICEKLKKCKIDKAIDLFPIFDIAVALFKARIKTRAGSGFRWFQWLYNRRIYPRRSRCEKKEWEYNLDIAELVFPGIDKSLLPKLYLNEEEREKAKKLLKELPRPIVGVFPGGGGEKRWSPEKFGKLCMKMESEGITPLVLLGPSEKELKAHFKEGWMLKESLDIRGLMGVISQVDAFVSNNTGPMHIAAAFRKPLVQIFDPRWAVNPRRWGHEYEKAFIIMPPVPHCKKCDESCQHYDCMEKIEVEDVWTALAKCLEESS